MAVTRVRDVRASRATSECVNRFLPTTSMILSFKSLRNSISIPSAGASPNTFASSLALRATTGLTFFIEHLLRTRAGRLFQFYLNESPPSCPGLVRDRLKSGGWAHRESVQESLSYRLA